MYKRQSHERETLEAVIAARSAAQAGLSAAKANPGDPEAMATLAAAQGQLNAGLGRLLAAVSYTHLDVYKRQVVNANTPAEPVAAQVTMSTAATIPITASANRSTRRDELRRAAACCSKKFIQKRPHPGPLPRTGEGVLSSELHFRRGAHFGLLVRRDIQQGCLLYTSRCV